MPHRSPIRWGMKCLFVSPMDCMGNTTSWEVADDFQGLGFHAGIAEGGQGLVVLLTSKGCSPGRLFEHRRAVGASGQNHPMPGRRSGSKLGCALDRPAIWPKDPEMEIDFPAGIPWNAKGGGGMEFFPVQFPPEFHRNRSWNFFHSGPGAGFPWKIPWNSSGQDQQSFRRFVKQVPESASGR